MRGFGFLCLFMLIGTAAFIYHAYSSVGSLSSNQGSRFLCLFMLIGTAAFTYHAHSSKRSLNSNAAGSNAMTSVLKIRKLKENRGPPTPVESEDHFDLEDYRPIDPSPSSKAAIRPGPVQHGTPLMPYIPNPSPAPGKPQHGG